jgi:hypothetical protein
VSNLSRQCCCGEGSACSAMCCNSSYAVSNFTIPVIFEKTMTGNANGADCGQGFCSRRSYQMDFTIQKVLPLVVTKVALSEGGCCYRGTGYVTITGSITIDDAWDGASIFPPPYNVAGYSSATYTFEKEVCVCITVRCYPKLDHCEGVTAPALQHTLEIGDWVMWCSHEGQGGGDCDTPPSNYGPIQLRCIGARFAFSSDVNCLAAVGDKQCLGWWPPTQQLCPGVGTSCFTNLEFNTLTNGPFAVAELPECTPDRDDESCIDPLVPLAFLKTINFGEPAYITNLLKSPCGNVDTDYNACSSINVAVRFLGGCPLFWSYS